MPEQVGIDLWYLAPPCTAKSSGALIERRACYLLHGRRPAWLINSYNSQARGEDGQSMRRVCLKLGHSRMALP